MESKNMEEIAGKTTALSKPKRISAKKKVSKQKRGVATRKMKSRKVSLESHPVHTPVPRSSPKSTSEEEFQDPY